MSPSGLQLAVNPRNLDRDYGLPGIVAPSNNGLWIPTGAALISGRALHSRFAPSRDMVLTKVVFYVTVASATDDAFDVGIYSADGNTKLVSMGALTSASGSVAGGGLNTVGIKTVTIPATTVKAGIAYYASLSSASTATILQADFRAPVAADLLGAAAGTRMGSFMTAHPLPATITVGSQTQQSVMLVLRES